MPWDPAMSRGTRLECERGSLQRSPAGQHSVDEVRQEEMTNTSIDLQELRKRIAEKAKAEPRHRFWGLYTHVWKLNVLDEAYRLAKKNGGAPGSDGVCFEDIEAEGVGPLLEDLSRELREKTYQPLPSRRVEIPKTGGTRMLKVPAIRDRIVQGALRLICEPIFEEDFQPGSFGYRPGRSAHQALERIRGGLYKGLRQVINLDLAGFYDSVRHDLLLGKLALRIQDPDILALCKKILKASGKRGLPQGSVIGPLWANVFLNDVDKMLEQAQNVTAGKAFECVRYIRWADDLLVLVSGYAKGGPWAPRVEKRLREEFGKLDLTVNEAKSSVVDFSRGEAFDFLGYNFRLVRHRSRPGKKVVLARPQRKRRTDFLHSLRDALHKHLHHPVEWVVRRIINPRVRGWVQYFRWGNSTPDLSFVRWQVEKKVRLFASRQRPKGCGCSWSKWSLQTIYKEWGLYADYRVLWRQQVANEHVP
jgi:RNA-directed DNA polymerase